VTDLHDSILAVQSSGRAMGGERGAGGIYITPYRLCRAQIDLCVLLEFSVNVMRIK